MKLSQIENGKTFKIGDTEFIKFSEENGNVTAVTRDIVAWSAFFDCRNRFDFGENRKLSEAEIFKKLKTRWLPKITNIIGEDNIVEFETDLLSLGGSSHDTMTSKVSLVTLDFYRQNRKIFDDYEADRDWWLATREGEICICLVKLADDEASPSWVSGQCGVDYAGVRPFCIFKSNISISR